MKEKERKEIARKIAAGQTLKEHIEEVSVFDNPADTGGSLLDKLDGLLTLMVKQATERIVPNI